MTSKNPILLFNKHLSKPDLDKLRKSLNIRNTRKYPTPYCTYCGTRTTLSRFNKSILAHVCSNRDCVIHAKEDSQ